jgi:hypothetical protein
MGVDKWFEQQLNPDIIKDDVLSKRLADYPTLTMTPEQALTAFPDRATIQAVANEKLQPPTDPGLAAVYEVQLVKLNKRELRKRIRRTASPRMQPTTPTWPSNVSATGPPPSASQASSSRSLEISGCPL